MAATGGFCCIGKLLECGAATTVQRTAAAAVGGFRCIGKSRKCRRSLLPPSDGPLLLEDSAALGKPPEVQHVAATVPPSAELLEDSAALESPWKCHRSLRSPSDGSLLPPLEDFGSPIGMLFQSMRCPRESVSSPRVSSRVGVLVSAEEVPRLLPATSHAEVL